MNRQDGMILGVMIIALGALGGAVYAISQSGDDSVVELSEFLSNRLNDHETTATKLDTRITENHDTIATERLNNIALSSKFISLEEMIDTLRIDVAILEARSDVTTLPTFNTPPPDTIQLQLTISDNKGNVKNNGYPRDVPAILIQGESTFLKKTYSITIKDPSGGFVKDKLASTLSDGDISEAWIPAGNPIPGVYTVTVSIDGKTDSIQFTLL